MGATVINGQLGTVSKYIAGTTINANDLVINTSTGTALVANPSVTLAVNNNSTAGITSTYAIAVNNASSSGSIQQGMNVRQNATMAQLSNGNIIVVQSGATTSNPKANGTFYIRSLLGGFATLSYPIVFSTDTIVYAVVYKLTSTTFVIAWLNTSNILKFQIYNNNGTTSGSTVTVATLGSSIAGSFSCNILTGGNFVFGYWKITSNNANFTIYNSSGTIVGSETTANASESPLNNFILPLSNGNFAYYWTGNSSHSAKFGIYSSTGSTVTAIQTIGTGSVTPTGGSLAQIGIQLANGNIVFQYMGPSSGYYFFVSIYSSSGTLITSNIQITASGQGSVNNDIYCGLCINAIGFSVASFQANTTIGNFTSFDSTGLTQLTSNINGLWNSGTPSVWGSQIGSQANSSVQLIFLGTSGYLVSTSTYSFINNCCGTVYLSYGYIYTLNSVGTTLASLNVINKSSGYTGVIPLGDFNCYLCQDDTVAISATAPPNGSSNTATYFGTYTIIQKSIAGVALENATYGQAFRVATNGIFNLNQTYTYGGPFNNTAATIVGAKGSLFGGQVSLG